MIKFDLAPVVYHKYDFVGIERKAVYDTPSHLRACVRGPRLSSSNIQGAIVGELYHSWGPFNQRHDADQLTSGLGLHIR
jgi:hypothetical protein